MVEKNPVRVVLEVDGYPAKTVALSSAPTPKDKAQGKGAPREWCAFHATSIGGTRFVLAGWRRHINDKRRELKRGDLIALVSHPSTPEFAVGIPVKFLRNLHEVLRTQTVQTNDVCGEAPVKPPVWVSNLGSGHHLGLPFPYAAAFESVVAPPSPTE